MVISYIRPTLVFCGALLVVADVYAASCSEGKLQKVSAVTLKSEHFSWYKTDRKSFFGDRKTKIIEAQVYNASSDNKLGFFRLNVTLDDGTNIPLNPSVSNVQIGPLQTATIRFNAPKSVLTKGTRASLLAQLFDCQVQKFNPNQPFEVVETPKVMLGQPVKPSADKIRQDEIYDNCIIDLMPNTATRIKQYSIIDKCERISKNPSWIHELKY